jgi:hypothetical protein
MIPYTVDEENRQILLGQFLIPQEIQKAGRKEIIFSI